MFSFLLDMGTPAAIFSTAIGVVGLVAGLFFIYTFARRLGIFGANRIHEWRENFAAWRPTRAVANLGSMPLRWRSKSGIQPKTLQHVDNRARFAPLNVKIPITNSAYKNIRTMGSHPEPISAVLKSTNPPTLKKTADGMFPIVTEVQVVESFDALSAFNREKIRVVGTLHNHKDHYDLAESCERKLAKVDLFFGRELIHVVVCPKGMQLYRAVQGSAEIKAEQME